MSRVMKKVGVLLLFQSVTLQLCSLVYADSGGECVLDKDGREISRPLDKESLRLLELAKTSPILALKHDKEGWLKLFAKEASVQDPVGAPEHKDLSIFWDTFIGPNEIVFDVTYDWVDKPRKIVYRAVDIHITFPSGGVQVQPVYLQYRYDDNDKLNALRAFWQMTKGYPRMESVLTDSLKYSVGATSAFITVFKNFGLSWGWEYVKGLGAGMFSGGEACVANFFEAYNNRNIAAMESTFATKKIVMTLPEGKSVAGDAKEVASALEETFNVVDIKVGKVYNSGYRSAVMIDVKVDADNDYQMYKGLAIFDIADKGSVTERIQIYW
mmetsp:Transcript_7419/g.9723  ORF Transcript_7419/g.9723 Transcript_7419/m.9723 type:complete len:326 (+) Transcript_7419:145-1122(+)